MPNIPVSVILNVPEGSLGVSQPGLKGDIGPQGPKGEDSIVPLDDGR